MYNVKWVNSLTYMLMQEAVVTTRSGWMRVPVQTSSVLPSSTLKMAAIQQFTIVLVTFPPCTLGTVQTSSVCPCFTLKMAAIQQLIRY